MIILEKDNFNLRIFYFISNFTCFANKEQFVNS